MAIEITPLGFQKPDGNEALRNGDNVIAANGAKAEELHQDARGRLSLIEAKNATQDGTLATHAARLANLDNAAGFTGDPLALNDAAFAETLTNGTETAAALDVRLTARVPPIVADAIAADPTVANSAATMAQNTAGLVPVWKATTSYIAGQRVISPGGDVVAAKVNFTSGTAYSSANWNASTQDGRIGAAESKNTTQDTRIEGLEVFKPLTQPRDEIYAHVALTQSGQLIEGELWDGTKHIPHLKSDRVQVPGSTTASGVFDGYQRVVVSATNQLIMGEKDDGTVYIPNLVTGSSVTETPTVSTTWKIVIVAGQSNSIWRFNTDGPKLAEPDARLKWWNRISGTVVDVSPNVTPSIASAFSRKYLAENPGVNLLVVPVTAGTTGFRTSSINPPPEGYLFSANGTWDRTLTADTNNLALRLFDSLAGARAATSNAEVLAMLWSQGENDRTRMTEATYGAALDDFLGTIRTQVSQPSMPVIIGSMTPEEIAKPQATGTEGILRALENTQARLVNTAYVWGPPNHLEYQEQIHWSPEGNRVRGEVMATDGLRRARLNLATSEPVSPRNVAIQRTGGTAIITWDYPLGRATSFTLETSTDSGATWTPVTLDGPLVRTATIAVSAALPLWARLTTTNETGTSYPTMEAKA